MEQLLHMKPPANWMNDPNGFIYYHGLYHLFYQHFPYAPVWGTMHWGHAVSEDLIHWRHLGIALFPTKPYDQDGVFSGSSLEKEGKLYLYYSAVRYLQKDPENIHRAPEGSMETSQALLISPDGFQFDNWEQKKQILPVCQDDAVGDPSDMRDPKVWQHHGMYYMVLGSTYHKKMGRAVFFESPDGVAWNYLCQLKHKNFGNTLECPDLFWIGEQAVFLGSPMGLRKAEEGYTAASICMLAQFHAGPPMNTSSENPFTVSESYQFIDYGMDFYAPQTNLDAEGRRVMLGWMRMPKAVKTEGEMPYPLWRGMMSLPRLVEIKAGHICFPVHPAVKRHFCREARKKDALDFTQPCRIQAVLQTGTELNIGGYRIWEENGRLCTDRSQVFCKTSEAQLRCSTPQISGEKKLDIFVEPNLVEIFVNDGEYVLSNIVYGLGQFLHGIVERISYGPSPVTVPSSTL